uniref:Protein kinase domain-containing protein n=1 Tax=Kalanchoe fedtschenkoi TaxID=63787 RepID=A0A7N0TYM6_KALFE
MLLERLSLVGSSAAVGEDTGGRTVVVGVRLDSQSRELLTWALVKVAQSGDRVIALHVLANSRPEGASSLLSLVKAFDSVLAVYEGFCNLKQVDLKLKVCRGDSVKKLLVKEAKAYAASKFILGISKTPHTIRSSVSVAKYCARKLTPYCWVLAVDNGKIVFMREAANDVLLEANTSPSNGDILRKKLVMPVHPTDTRKFKGQNYLNNGKEFVLHKCREACVDTCVNYTGTEMVPNNKTVSKSLAIVPFQGQSTCSAKSGWSFIRKMFVLDWPSHPKSKSKKLPGVQWALRVPNQHSSAAIYPDQNKNRPCNYRGNHTTMPAGIDARLASFSPHHDSTNHPKELECLPGKYSSMCRLFSLQELLLATSGFVPENMVGKGGSSWVYHGCLPDGKELAVKVSKPSEDIIKEFVSEIEIITAVSHKNIVSLFGFCLDANYLILVYDYLPRGSLEENLHGDKKDSSSFQWNERYKVALGVAEALNYLHNGSKEPVIHRDVKSSNILLSDDFEPRLSDFGLAQWASGSSSEIVCTDVAGTFGYLAPEYFMHGKVTDKIDVYAFGVVLLELLSGRKPISSDNLKGQVSLVMWAKPILEDGKLSDLLDPSLSVEIDCHEIERMVLAARLCIRRSPRLRPQMNTILKLLQGDPEVTNWATQQAFTPENHACMDDDVLVPSNIQSHLNLALLDLKDDDVLSVVSMKQSVCLEDYLRGRRSLQSSFD